MSLVTRYTFDEQCFSDLHKDAFGFRPSSAWWAWLKIATDDEKQYEWDGLIHEMGQREVQRAAAEKAAGLRFETLVARSIEAGAKTRDDAIRWLMDSDSSVRDDISYFEYLMGIPYGYLKDTKNIGESCQ